MGSEIEITVYFIGNSFAVGCFVVLQSDNYCSPDEFRVLLRSGSDLSVTDMISVPPSTYTLRGRDGMSKVGGLGVHEDLKHTFVLNIT